jgi:hypothetical protein
MLKTLTITFGEYFLVELLTKFTDGIVLFSLLS